MHAHMSAVLRHGLYRLDIRLGELLGPVIGMAHFVAAELAFFAYIAFTRHCKTLHELYDYA